jgi:hypothetical protein
MNTTDKHLGSGQAYRLVERVTTKQEWHVPLLTL